MIIEDRYAVRNNYFREVFLSVTKVPQRCAICLDVTSPFLLDILCGFALRFCKSLKATITIKKSVNGNTNCSEDRMHKWNR